MGVTYGKPLKAGYEPAEPKRLWILSMAPRDFGLGSIIYSQHTVNQPEDIVMVIIQTFPDSLIPVSNLLFGDFHQMIGQAYAGILIS